MYSNVLYEQRKVAIHLLRSGVSKTQVASKLNRSYSWVNKWWDRYNDNQDFASLHDLSHIPKHLSRKLDEETCREIRVARSELEAENAENKHKVAIGAKAVQERLKLKGVKIVPSTSSIERILRQACMIRTHKVQNKPPKDHFQETEMPSRICKSDIGHQKILEMTALENCAKEVMPKYPQVSREKSDRNHQSNTFTHDSMWILKLL